MNGIDKITGKINGDAEAEISGILGKARADASSVAASFAQKAQSYQRDLISRAEEQASERIKRARSVSELEAKKALLAKKQELISRAFDLAYERLLKFPDNEYIDFLCRLAANASSSGTEEIILSAQDRSRFGKQIVIGANKLLSDQQKNAGLTLSEEIRPLKGGLVLKNKDVELNCTLDTIVRLIKEDLSFEVAKVLFG